MRCLVTGAAGLLGTYLADFLKRQNDEVLGWDLPAHDVTDVDRLINDVHSVKPDVVLHLAAWTDVDGCETDAARATAVNFQGTWAAALASAEVGCRLLYVSTDYVFDGAQRRPYRESDKTNPLSVYGRTKLAGESAVLRTTKKHFIVRTSWLYGRHGRNFVDTIRRKSTEAPQLEVVDDQFGSPTFARDICRPIWELVHTDQYGIYHLTNSGWCSWYELATEVVRATGVACQVVPIDTAAAKRPAPRPPFSALENRNFKRKFHKELRPWQQALKAYLDESQAAPAGS